MASSRVRSRLRRLAARVLGSEQEPRPSTAGSPPSTDHTAASDLDGLPPLQPGRGETPGPNHKQDISQEWAAAQLFSGVSPLFIDLRSSAAFRQSHVPGAVSAPASTLREMLEALPDKSERIAVYDADGAQGSEREAAWLRDQGWTWARRLVGGFEEWTARGEAVEGSEPEG